MNTRQAVRLFYRTWMPKILAAGRNEWADGDAYLWEHVGGIRLTPIGTWLWSDIRALDAVLYPQFQVGPYFVDFGNPIAKVAIECDGAAWHKDKEKDATRQAELEALGWTVYRLTGAECRTEQDAETGKSGPAYLLVKEVSERHRIRRGHS